MTSEVENAFGQILKRHRQSAGLTRQAFAILVGLDSSYVHRLEKGNRRPSRRIIVVMGDALGLGREELNRWLIAAGHGTLPLSRSAVRGRAPEGAERDASRVRSSVAPDRGIEAIGIEVASLNRLIHAVGNAPTKEQRRVSRVISSTVRLLTENLEAPVRTAVIPAAGGVHRVVAHHVMERLLLRAIGEAAQCGIAEIVLVITPEMEKLFYRPLRELLEVLTLPLLNLRFCLQPQADGLGDAILKTADLIGDQSFAVLLPDDILNTPENRFAKIMQLQLMIDAFAKLDQTSLVAVTGVSKRKLTQYGVVEVEESLVSGSTLPIRKLIEKPSRSHAIVNSPKAFGIVGRYILQPDVFKFLSDLRELANLPVELTTALEKMRTAKHDIRAFPLKGARQDFGSALGQANNLIDN